MPERSPNIRQTSAKDAKTGQPIRVFRDGEKGKLVSRTRSTHNGKPCFLLELEIRGEIHSFYVGEDHAVWEG